MWTSAIHSPLMVNSFSSNSQVAHSETPKRNSDVIWRCWVSTETELFCRSSLRFKGHPRPVVRSTENSTNPSISEGCLCLQWWRQACFQKEFLPGPKHWPRPGIHIRRNRVSELHLDILGHNCIQDQNPWCHKKQHCRAFFQNRFPWTGSTLHRIHADF